ncbi:DUF4139 domain-containing protein [Pseudochryseolinea flava]|nr:DUF4139 domain-containing protein [Pseudochryseolinea flava]
MKRMLTALCCIIMSAVNAQEITVDAKSRIGQVTVFLQGAQITRQAPLTLKAGVSVVKLSEIAPVIIEQSLRAESSNDAVKILSVSFQVNYLQGTTKPERLTLLESERRKLMERIAEEKSQREVYAEEEAVLKANRSLGGQKGVAVDELKAAADYFRIRFSEIKQKELQIDRNIRQHNEALGKIEAQIKELSGEAQLKSVGEIFVKLSAKSAVQTTLTLSYLVQNAKWFPSYDIRAKDIKSPVAITYKANISQQSGEDWDNVKLTISSGNPTQAGTKPEIKPWLLGFNNQVSKSAISSLANSDGSHATLGMVRGRLTDDAGQPLPGVNVMIKGTTVGAVTDSEGYYSLMLTRDAQTLVFSFIGYQAIEQPIGNREVVNVSMIADQSMLSEVVVMGYGTQKKSMMTGAVATVKAEELKQKRIITATPVVRQTTVEFTLEDKFTIASDGEFRITDMVEYDLDALYEYYCVPKMDNDAFLVAKVLGWEEYNFLDGEASLFFEGKYIGKSIMDAHNTGDTLTLSLGRDANVVVTREKVKDLSSKQFIGANQKSVFAYDITVRNKKNFPITIVVEDQLPIPNTKEITVDKIEDSKAEHNEQTGILKWKKEVEPGKSELLKFKYAIRYPKQNQMVLE